MATYQQSPGVQVVEKNASTVTTGLSTTIGAYVGSFQWGPVNNPILLGNEGDLVNVYGTPNADTFAHFFAVSGFLTYANAMWVNRVVADAAMNATVVGGGLKIDNYDTYAGMTNLVLSAQGTFAARYPGALGNGLKVSIADSATYDTWVYKSNFSGKPGTSEFVASKGGSNDELHVVVVDALGKFSGTVGTVLEKFEFVSKASDAISYQGLNNYYPDVLANRSSYVYWLSHDSDGTNWGDAAANKVFVLLSDNNNTVTGASAACVGTTATVTFADFGSVPFVVGETITVAGFTAAGYNGSFVVTGTPSNTSVSYTVPVTLGASTVQGTVTSAKYDFTYTLSGGVDANVLVDADLQLGWDVFSDSQNYDISLLVTGNASKQLAAYVVQNVADVRTDCVAFTSITATTTGPGAPIFSTDTSRVANAVAFKTFDSSYAVIDSGYKYVYDKYNDKYRWVALNADTAGLCARVDTTNDPWFSPAGMTKGQIKGAIKLAWNPTKAERDQLYPAAINPVVNQVGKGTILFGDRTATTKPSAFDRINVRRLFLILEKSIANSAKYQLFELNDSITRLQFVASVEPFLRDVQGRRGIQDFKVICDETNNTPQVIATNNFVGTILVRPQYSINFITLNFVAVGPNVTFELAATV